MSWNLQRRFHLFRQESWWLLAKRPWLPAGFVSAPLSGLGLFPRIVCSVLEDIESSCLFEFSKGARSSILSWCFPPCSIRISDRKVSHSLFGSGVVSLLVGARNPQALGHFGTVLCCCIVFYLRAGVFCCWRV